MEIANVNENYIVDEFNPTIAISIQCPCTNLLYNQLLQFLPEFRSHTNTLCKCVDGFSHFVSNIVFGSSFGTKINQPNRSIFFFHIEERKPGILSEIVMAEWILANQIDSSIYYDIQHSLHDWNDTPVHFFFFFVTCLLYVILHHLCVESRHRKCLACVRSSSQVFVGTVTLSSKAHEERSINNQHSLCNKRSFKIFVDIPNGMCPFRIFNPWQLLQDSQLIHLYHHHQLHFSFKFIPARLDILSFSFFSASSHSLYCVYFSSSFCADFHLLLFAHETLETSLRNDNNNNNQIYLCFNVRLNWILLKH